MPIQGLTIIGESINDSVPSTNKLFEANDIEGLKNLATMQAERGAAYIDINVGSRSAEFMADLIRQVQNIIAKPLSIDTPDPELAKAGLEAYDADRAGGQMPIINSISPLRMEMFELIQIQPFIPILLVSERSEEGMGKLNRTADEVYQTARGFLDVIKQYNIPISQCIIDPAIAPICSDSEGHLQRLIGAMQMIHDDPDFSGVHMSVGLSNFTVMLPPKRADGSPLKGPLESAFLTTAMPLGLDHVIGSVKRKYQLLDEDHPAMICFNNCLAAEGFDVIMHVQEFYS